MPRYDKLFEPLQVGKLTLKNRIVRSPHGTGFSGDDLVAYHEARARGGVALSTIEATSVHPSAPLGIPIYQDSSMPMLEKLATRMHQHDMKLLIQITWVPGERKLNIKVVELFLTFGGPASFCDQVIHPQQFATAPDSC